METKSQPPSFRKGILRPWPMTFTAVGVLLAALVLLMLVTPSPVTPLPWTPPPRPELTGVLAANTALQNAEQLARGAIPGPEDIAFDHQGRLYTGSSDGTIYRVGWAAGREIIEPFVATGGRPLGLAFDAAGNLIVADAQRGLLEVSPQGELRVLSSEADGAPITYADELAIATDGTIYFSDASSRFESGFPYDLLEARPYGRLLAFDPRTGGTRELLDDLYFANGVALSSDERFVLVVESFRYRITRFWLRGPRAGTSDVFADNLIGFADNITATPEGAYWVAMNNLRPGFIDFMHPRPFLKSQFAKLGQARIRALASNNRYGLVVQLGPDGQVLRTLHDPAGNLASLSTAVPYRDWLYLGSLFDDTLGRLALAEDE